MDNFCRLRRANIIKFRATVKHRQPVDFRASKRQQRSINTRRTRTHQEVRLEPQSCSSTADNELQQSTTKNRSTTTDSTRLQQVQLEYGGIRALQVCRERRSLLRKF